MEFKRNKLVSEIGARLRKLRGQFNDYQGRISSLPLFHLREAFFPACLLPLPVLKFAKQPRKKFHVDFSCIFS